MSVVVTSFINDDRACRPRLLKTESTIDILIDQIHKFQNSYFKEHPWKAATVLQKACCLRGVVYEHAMKYAHDSTFKNELISKLTETLTSSPFVSNFLNFV